MVHEDFKEMLAAHALTALDAGDARSLEAHLDSCQTCRDEFDKWLSTAAVLAFAGDVIEPSAQVREKILDQARREGQPVKRAPSGSGGSSETAAATKVLPFESPRRKNLWTSIGTLGAIAAVVIFAALIISLIVLWRENQITQGELA